MAAQAGLVLDHWQCFFLDHALVEHPRTHKYAAMDVGLMVSRQNGKGSVLEAVELADLFLLDTELCIHSAHVFETSKDAQRRLAELIESSPDLDRYFSSHRGKSRVSNSDPGFELLRDGKWRRVKFKTRTKGGGRGLTGDRVVIDEAMFYIAEQDAALRPTLSARSITGSPQIWQTGSAGDKESTQFGKLRNLALAGVDPHLVWAEWSIDNCSDQCPTDCDEHDPVDSVASYAKANPGLGVRISVEYVENERSKMDPEEFLQEILGVGDWPVEGDAWQVIDEESWNARCDPRMVPDKPLVFAVDVTPDKKWACIAVAGTARNGMTAVEVTSSGTVFDHRRGTGWVVPRLVELVKQWKPAGVVIDKGTQAGVFVDELEAAGVKLLLPSFREYAQGCGLVHTGIVPRRGNEPTLVHRGQSMLTTAVAGAVKRDAADLWAWDKKNATTDICPLVAATLAVWGHTKVTNKPTPKPMVAWG